MSARLFLSPWTGSIGGEVTNPIVDYIETFNNVGWVSMYYGDGDADGLPDFPLVLVLVYSSNYTGAQIETLENNIPGVHLIPSIRPDYPLINIPLAKRQAIENYLNSNGIDTSSLNATSTYKDLILLIVNTLAPSHGHTGLLKWAKNNQSEFD